LPPPPPLCPPLTRHETVYTAYSFYDVDIDLNNLGGYGPDLYDGDGNFNPEFIRYKNFGVDVSLRSEYPTSFVDEEDEANFRMAEGIVVDAYSEFIKHEKEVDKSAREFLRKLCPAQMQPPGDDADASLVTRRERVALFWSCTPFDLVLEALHADPNNSPSETLFKENYMPGPQVNITANPQTCNSGTMPDVTQEPVPGVDIGCPSDPVDLTGFDIPDFDKRLEGTPTEVPGRITCTTEAQVARCEKEFVRFNMQHNHTVGPPGEIWPTARTCEAVEVNLFSGQFATLSFEIYETGTETPESPKGTVYKLKSRLALTFTAFDKPGSGGGSDKVMTAAGPCPADDSPINGCFVEARTSSSLYTLEEKTDAFIMVGWDWTAGQWSGDKTIGPGKPYEKPGTPERENYDKGRANHIRNFPLMKYDYPCLGEEVVELDCAPMFQSDINVEWRSTALRPAADRSYPSKHAPPLGYNGLYGCKVDPATDETPPNCEPPGKEFDREYIGYMYFKAKEAGYNWESTCNADMLTILSQLNRPENGLTEAQTDASLEELGYISDPGSANGNDAIFISKEEPMADYIDYADLENRVRAGKSRIRPDNGEDRIIHYDLANSSFWNYACVETGKENQKNRNELCEMAKREHHRSEVRKSFTLTYGKGMSKFYLEFSLSSDKQPSDRGPTRYSAPGYYPYKVQWQMSPNKGDIDYRYPNQMFDFYNKDKDRDEVASTFVQVREPPFSGNWPDGHKHHGLEMDEEHGRRARNFQFMAGVHDLVRDYVADESCGSPPSGREDGKSAREKYFFRDDYPEMYQSSEYTNINYG
jgi:hypothetical protein